MGAFFLWSRNHPKTAISILVFFTLLFGYHLKDIYIDASADGMMLENDPDRGFYDETLKTFGSDNITIVYVKDKNLFGDPAKLKAVEDVFYKLKDIPGVSRVDSLFNATNFKGEDGVLQTNPLMDYVPDDPAELQKIKADALRSPLLNKTLIAPDGGGIAINVVVDSTSKDRGFNTRIANDIDKTLEPLKGKVDQAFQVGSPMTRRYLSDCMMGDQATLVPLAVVILILMLIVGVRTWNGGIVPMCTGGLSILWTFGFMAWVGIPINVLTVIVPSLLIVVGSSEDMHFVTEYIESFAESGSRMKAIEIIGRKLGIIIVLTSGCGLLGFLSVILNDIVLLKQFGYTASFGFFVNPLITFLFIPVYLRYFGETKLPKRFIEAEKTGKEHTDVFKAFANWLVPVIERRKKVILVISLLLVLISGYGALKIEVDNDLLGYFKPTSQLRVCSAQLHKELSGTQNFFLTFEGKKAGAFKKPENLQKLFEIQKFINTSGLFDSSLSLPNHVALINKEMNEGKPEEYRIPDKADLIPQYLLFFTSSDLERYVSPDYSKTNIIVRHNISSSVDLKNALKKLDEVIEKSLGAKSRIKHKSTGECILINKAADSIAQGQLQSLGVLLFVLFTMMSILFMRLKAGFVAVAANLIPIAMLFGIMGYFKIALGVGTSMIADVVLGIAIDDTLHMMCRYNDIMKKVNNQSEALLETMRENMNPVITVSIGLALGFGIMMFSNLIPLFYFGALSAIVLGLGLISELFISTSLLSNAKIITLWDMLGLQLTEKVIKGSPLFKNMRPWQIKKVVLCGFTQEFAKDTHVIRQGEKGRAMYLILNGTAKVEYAGKDGKRVHLQDLNPGDVFGEIALVDEVERTANVIATQDSRVLQLDWTALERIRNFFPRISSKFFLNISRILGGRLANTNVQLGKLAQAPAV